MNIAVTAAAIVKKVLEFLASNKKGRKFLGYTIGIVLFLVLLPMIVLLGLFGWMSGGNAVEIPNVIQQQVQAQYAEQYPEHAEALEKISDIFGTYGQAKNVGLAQMIYIGSALPDCNTDDTFYTDYVECFVNVTAEKTLTDNITEAFGISFSAKDADNINSIYKKTEV